MSGTGDVRAVRTARIVAGAVVPGQLARVVCPASGIRPTGWVSAASGAAALAVCAWQAWALRSLYAHRRGLGLEPPAALRAAVRAVVPVQMRRLLVHEPRTAASLVLWAARRTHGVTRGERAAGYTGPQTALVCGLLFVSVIETVALAYLIPWPVLHRIVLVLAVYTVLQVLGLHGACVTRPHVVHADGSLRIRYGALFDLTVPAESIVSARVERRYPRGRLLTLSEEGVLDLIVAGQTGVTLELNRPLAFTRPLGRTGEARVVRFHADDPSAPAEILRETALTRIPPRRDT